MHLQIKTYLRKMSESRKFRKKNNAKLTQAAYFFFSKNLYFIEKITISFFNFQYKNKNIYQFHTFTLKNSFKNMSEISELRFQNTL